MRRGISLGMLLGLITWTTYAVIECWFATIIHFINESDFPEELYHWGFALILFCVYALVGMITGGILGLFAYALGKRKLPFSQQYVYSLLSISIIFTILISFLANLVSQVKLSPPMVFLATLVLVIMIILVMTAGSQNLCEKFGFLMKPAAVSAILVGEAWVLSDLLGKNPPRFSKAGVASIYLIGAILILFMIHRYLKILYGPRSEELDLKFIRRKIAFLMAIVLFTIGVSAKINRSPGPIVIGGHNSAGKTNSPNVILIVMDTVRADHLSLYGYERDTTPNIRIFAKEATVYRHAIASSDTTLSTHASLFTGTYARRHGAHMKPPEYPYGRPLSVEFETIAEVLLKEGYSTLAVVSNYSYLRPEFGFAKGFQYYDFRKPVRFLEQSRAFYLRSAVYRIFRDFLPRVAFDKKYLNAAEINSQVFKSIDKSIEGRRPLFLFINYMDAHIPYIPPDSFDTLYPGKIDAMTSEDESALIHDVMKLRRNIRDIEYRHLVSQYDGAIAYLDSQIMLLIDGLKKLGLYDKSLIILTSDHGEAFGEKNLIEHGHSVYQNQVKVPLVIKYPGIANGKKVDQLASSVDILPTILDVLGLKIPEIVQGQSLLKNSEKERRIILSESFPDATMLKWHPRFHRIQRALFLDNIKLIKSTNGNVELYNLEKDPNEMTNLYGSDIRAQELKTRINRWLNETKEAPNPPVDKKMLERLKSLGYVNK